MFSFSLFVTYGRSEGEECLCKNILNVKIMQYLFFTLDLLKFIGRRRVRSQDPEPLTRDTREDRRYRWEGGPNRRVVGSR